MRRQITGWLASLVVLFSMASSPAQGAFHLMKVVEVFPGTSGSPNAQYVMLQMFAGGQNIVSGHFVRVYNASGGTVATFTFGGNVANGANQATILIATTDAQTLFGISADLVMTPVLPLAGGAVCFDGNPDCVSWGNFTGNAMLLSAAGTPYFDGLVLGHAIRRVISAGNPTQLEAGDDTNNSATDFVCANPALPKNNAGATGTYTDGSPCPTCGNNVDEAGEECDGSDASACPGLCQVSCFCTPPPSFSGAMPALPPWALGAFVILIALWAPRLLRSPRAPDSR